MSQLCSAKNQTANDAGLGPSRRDLTVLCVCIRNGRQGWAEKRTVAFTRCYSNVDTANRHGGRKRIGQHDGPGSLRPHGCKNGK
jgi:hypothetical protein